MGDVCVGLPVLGLSRYVPISISDPISLSSAACLSKFSKKHLKKIISISDCSKKSLSKSYQHTKYCRKDNYVTDSKHTRKVLNN